MLNSMRVITYITALFVAVCQPTGDASAQTTPQKQAEAKLLAVLKSDVTYKQKADACRELAVIATPDAIATLAPLLADEKLSHMARYALETIPNPAVDDTFRDALEKLKGPPLVGVIASIGVRRDPKAVRPLIKKLKDSDSQVARAAAFALGNIANQQATRALQRALKKSSGHEQLALSDGLFRCARKHAARGHTVLAIEIYEQLLTRDAPHQVRSAALRGAILTHGKDSLSLLRKYLRSEDYHLFSAAVQTTSQLPHPQVTQALTDVLDQRSPDRQILLIQTLAARGDAKAVPALVARIEKSQKPVRLAAIRSLPAIGCSAGLKLIDFFDDSDSEISKAALDSFAAVDCSQADKIILDMLENGDTNNKLLALDLMGRRRMTKHLPLLLDTARNDAAKVRPVALKTLGQLAGPAQFDPLLMLLMELKISQDLQAAQQALIAVCNRSKYQKLHTEKVIHLLNRANPAQKSALLAVLGALGGPDALTAVRKAIKDSEPTVQTTAINVLLAWKTADAAPDLLAMAKTSPNPTRRIAALRGYIHLIQDKTLSTKNKLSMCTQADQLVQRDAEMKLLLSVLGQVPRIEALSMAMAQLESPAVRSEACLAVVAISEKIIHKNPDEIANALQTVLRTTDNKNVTRRARTILKKAKTNPK